MRISLKKLKDAGFETKITKEHIDFHDRRDYDPKLNVILNALVHRAVLTRMQRDDIMMRIYYHQFLNVLLDAEDAEDAREAAAAHAEDNEG